MYNFTRKLLILSCFLFTGFCFWKAGTGLIGGADATVLPSAQAAVHPSYIPPRVVTPPIQQMRPGMRIVGRNPLRIQTEPTIDPTPEGWRLVSVRMLKEDGTYFEAELLRPLSWIYRHHAQPGAVIQLNMPEMYVVGAAEVLSISDCPPIDPGDGPVVISTFKNVSHNVLNLYVEGETEPIGVTAGHPIWSEDRQAFVHTDQLQPGERLRSAVGKTVRITSIEIRAGPEPVYNLEIAGEHVYSVTDSGLLVHNAGPCYLVPRGQNVDLNALKVADGPYDSRTIRSQLEARYGAEAVTSTTVPPTSGKMVQMSGRQHSVTGVVYDSKGVPIFDRHSLFDTYITRQYSSVADEAAHMRAATRELRSSLGIGQGQANRVAALGAIKNKVNFQGFNPVQLRQIMGGKKNIDGLTWHHHQDIGRMQLVDRVIHAETGHVGGFKMWFGY
ncbi:HNH endonuclease [Gimesia maris]|uniref:Intein C-terminal splicing domain-containing protein n=1 Tax=Gimesia maris TaxID=122 RepID=A0ABX5YKQ0_9PLAN|nr:HNH endonuclease [Gimesia maris]EDL57454.1 MafB1 [Gimesia maris DSM 8797]QEG16138.1 hypothetical protein GmarT_19990 [Gimesia maris]QGQ30626.1 hypothetical protein F1729_19325 [Gimesia maris]